MSKVPRGSGARRPNARVVGPQPLGQCLPNRRGRSIVDVVELVWVRGQVEELEVIDVAEASLGLNLNGGADILILAVLVCENRSERRQSISRVKGGWIEWCDQNIERQGGREVGK